MNSPELPDEKFSPRTGALCAVAVVFIVAGLALALLPSELPGMAALVGIVLVSWGALAVVGTRTLAKLRVRWRDAQIERSELLHLTDRELSDIGLNRLDVRGMIDANWWQDPEVLQSRTKRRN